MNNQQFIQHVYSNPEISFLEKTNLLAHRVLDIPKPKQSELVSTLNTTETVTPGNTLPYQPSAANVATENYQYADQVANHFNNQVRLNDLNVMFADRVNQLREEVGWSPISVGYHLKPGAVERVRQLSEYHYLGGQTIDNQDFRSLFTGLENPEYRLGEQLYELYISANDIHLQTWENTEILADYLYDAFGDSLVGEANSDFNSQYIAVRAEPSDVNIGSSPYVRIVVTLVLDTQV